MPDAEPLTPFLSVLRDLVAWLQAERVPGMLIGGIAASLLGRPRVTRDVDAVVILDEASWDGFLAAGSRHGFVPRRPDCLEFAQRSRVLLARHVPSDIEVDVVFGSLPFEVEAIKRAVCEDVAGVRVPVPTPEDLIIMKALAHRPRDLIDIEGILNANPKLDRRRVRASVRSISTALEMPEILDDLETLLARRPRRSKKS